MLPRRLIFLHAQLKSEIRSKTGLKRFLPAILSGEFENAKVELVRWQGSGDIAGTASTNCYIVIPPDRENFPAGDPAKNTDHSREWPGFAPWAITEYYGKLKSAFSYLKAFQEAGTPEEVANAQANILYVMGVMGHYVGDCAQPLHATKHHHGWVGANPNGYTTWYGIHAWIDGGLIGKAAITTGKIVGRVVPAQPIALAVRPDGRDAMFVAVMDYITGTQKLVEPLYQLEKAGKLGDDKVTLGSDGKVLSRESRPVTDEGREFIETQLLRGGEMLGAIWLTAWRSAAPDPYLRAQLLKRQAAAAPAKLP